MTEHAALLFQLDIEESQLDCLQADLRRSVENTPTKRLSLHHMTSNFLLQSLQGKLSPTSSSDASNSYTASPSPSALTQFRESTVSPPPSSPPSSRDTSETSSVHSAGEADISGALVQMLHWRQDRGLPRGSVEGVEAGRTPDVKRLVSLLPQEDEGKVARCYTVVVDTYIKY